MPRWAETFIVSKRDRLRRHRTNLDARSAPGASLGSNNRTGNDESTCKAADAPRTIGRRSKATIHVEVANDEGLDRISEKVNIDRTAETGGLAVNDRPDEVDVEPDQSADRRIDGDRIVREQEYVHRARPPIPRPVPFHRHDPVHHKQARAEEQTQVREHSGEEIDVRSRAWNSGFIAPTMHPN